jgi:hypothetical protein
MSPDKFKLKILCGDIPSAYCARHDIHYPYGTNCPACEIPPDRGPVAKYVTNDPAPLGAMAKALREAGYIARRQ